VLLIVRILGHRVASAIHSVHLTDWRRRVNVNEPCLNEPSWAALSASSGQGQPGLYRLCRMFPIGLTKDFDCTLGTQVSVERLRGKLIYMCAISHGDNDDIMSFQISSFNTKR
jgi:hypothetical protein